EGHPDTALGPTKEVRDWFEKARKNDDQVTATAVLIAAQLAEGKSTEAFKELGKAAAMAARSQNMRVQLDFAIAQARVRAAGHDFGSATAILNKALAKATKSGYLAYEFEIRLALEEVTLKSGRSRPSHGGLERLQQEAKAKGFNLISHK